MNPIKATLDQVTAKLHDMTDNSFAGLKKALPDFFNNTNPNVVEARDRLMTLIGNAQTAADQKFLGVPVRDLAQLGDSLYDSVQAFTNHTNEISGVGPEGTGLLLEPLYGNVQIQGVTVNVDITTAATTVVPMTGDYPKINVGETIVVNSQELTVIGKNYTTATGTVSVNAVTANLNVVATGVNLASYVSANKYIKIGSEIKRVNTVNGVGDYLTVYTPFTNSYSGATLNVESSIRVNTSITANVDHGNIYIRTPFCANSLCLDTFITGNGTNFTSTVQANTKIYYDEKEYIVVSVTDTRIEVDQPVFLKNNQPIYFVIDEYMLPPMVEGNKPDDILSHFETLDQLTSAMDDQFKSDLKNLKTTVRKNTGFYEVVPVTKPTDTVKSLENAYLVNRATMALQGVLDDFQADMISALTNADIVLLIQQKEAQIQQIKDDLVDSVKRDLAAINAIKGLLGGLLKMFIISCSKKKAKDGDGTSDEYLQLILVPNPMRQGCAATDSDLIGIFDDSFAEYCDPGLPDTTFTPVTDDEGLDALENLATEANTFDETEETETTAETTGIGGEDITGADGTGITGVGTGYDGGYISIDGDPEQPAPVVDPCTQPC